MNIDLGKLEMRTRIVIAESAFVETEVLEFLAKDRCSLVREKVAANLNSTELILDSLSKDEDIDVRTCVAKNPNTPVKILDFLSRDEAYLVRLEVAMNESTLSETLERLSSDKNPIIRRGVASNKNTSQDTLALLVSKEHDCKVKYFIARNPNTPKEIKENFNKIISTNISVENSTIQFYSDFEDDDWD